MSEVLFFKTSIRFSEAGLRVLPVRLRPGRRPPAVGQDRYRFSRQAQALLFMSLAFTDLTCVLVASFAANAGSLGHMSATLAVMVFVVACRAGWGRPVATSRQLASAAARDVAFALAALVVSPLASSLVEGSPRTSLIQSVMTGGLVLIAGRVCLLALSARRAEWLIERVVVLGRDHEASRWARSPCIDGLRVACAGAVLVGDGPCQMAVIDRIAPGSHGWAARILDDSGVRLLKRVDRFLLLQTDLTPAETDSALRWLEGVSQAVHLVEEAPRSQGDMPLRLSRLRPATVSSGNLAAKRMLDITLAGSALLLLLPALLLIGALIRLESRGPALFRQTRAGCNNLPFTVLKFRTMSVDGNAGDGSVQAVRGDARVTRLGRILRKTSIDELPQLLNVVGGSMSLVGPRPHPIALNRRFEPMIAHYASRHSVLPGITGWAQVNGARGETATLDQMRRRVELDLEYVRRRSTAMDLLILVRTVGSVIAARNVY